MKNFHHGDHKISFYRSPGPAIYFSMQADRLLIKQPAVLPGETGMNYRKLALVSVLALTTAVQAADEGGLSEDEQADIRVSCIEQAIAAETEDDQMDAVVEECVTEEQARRKPPEESQD